MEADDRHAPAGGQEIDSRLKAVAELVEFPVDGDSEGLKRESGSGRTFASACFRFKLIIEVK